MNKQEVLYSKYAKYQEACESRKKSSQTETVRILIFGVLLPFVLACILIQQKSIVIAMLGFVCLGICLLLFAYLGAKWFKINPMPFETGEEWESTLKAYLEDCGVDTQTAKPPYRHTDKYESDEGWAGFVLVYATQAKVNGVDTSVEVQERPDKLIVLTPDAELAPTP